MSKAKKALKIAQRVFTVALVAFTIFIMLFTVISMTSVNRNNAVIFGHRFYIVKTDSMSLSDKNADLKVHFNAGDIVVIRAEKDNYSYEAGDVIAFISTNPDSYGETITHMIRRVEKNARGEVVGYVSYGTNTDTDDPTSVEPDFILGRYVGKLPTVGRFFAFLKTVPGYIICILVPFTLLILSNGLNIIRLFRLYKREQTKKLEAERAEIEAERAENKRMMQELLALKALLEKQGMQQAPPGEDGEAPSPDDFTR